jgi:heat shock protein HtpX
MPRRGSREVFRPDAGLRVRVWIALALNGVLLVGLLAVAYWLVFTIDDGWSVLAFFVFFAVFGATVGPPRRRRLRDPHVERALTERAARAVSRLSLVADLPAPATVVVREDAPLSWTTALPRRTPRIHVTTSLLGRLTDAELEAVIAHEISHVGNRDAVLMTVLASPGVFVLRGMRRMWHDPDAGLRAKLGLIMFFLMMAPPAIVSAGLCRIVSRHRELAADRGAAVLTGSSAALAAALRKLSNGLHAIPDKDLRLVAASDVLHVVPARPARGIARLWATHPPLEDRIRRLERLEARLQA